VDGIVLWRTPERDLMPMAKALDLAVTPWASLAGGALSGKYLKGEKGRVPENSIRVNERSQKIAQLVVDIAKDLDVTPAQVALNWCRQKNQVVIPIVGARTLAQIEDSLGCVNFQLSNEQIAQLDEISKIEIGFPHDFLGSDNVKNIMSGETWDRVFNHRS
jgi:aryl-alcohol dehydrogenase-like predicted oxidoreductase